MKHTHTEHISCDQGCEILYLNVFFQKNKYFDWFNFSNKYIVFIVLQYFRKTIDYEIFFLGRETFIYKANIPMLFICIKEDFTLEINYAY